MPELVASLTVRLEPADKAELERLAREAGLPASLFVRQLIRQHLASTREAEGR